MLHRIITTAIFVVAAITATAQSLEVRAGLNLKNVLHTLISQHKDLGYTNLWNAYATTDVDATGHIIDMYSNVTRYMPEDHGDHYTEEGSCLNREHTVPQSWFGEHSPMRADLFQVYPVDGWVNNMRSNHPYGEVGTVSKTSANGYSKLGSPSSTLGAPSTITTVFEPADEYKGDLARTYFYMVVCYQDKLADWTGEVFGKSVAPDAFNPEYPGYPGMAEWAIKMFIKWSEQDPVSQKERDRNEAVYKLQGNRNPFIDCPGLERFIWSEYLK